MDKYEQLRQTFGYTTFRGGQEPVIDAILQKRDVLAVMPTGAGKSICYQLPALLQEGISLVISPLISLMKDQVAALKQAGVAAAYINSSLTPGQTAEALRRAANNAYKIIYVAPERLDVASFRSFAQQADIRMITVDEAHCISQWGQDFRPSYLAIPDFVRSLPTRPLLNAFTATATLRVREDILRALALQEPFVQVTGFDRPNLRYAVMQPRDKYALLKRLLEDRREQCGIVYCATRKDVEEVQSRLRDDGFSAVRYHAGLADVERSDNQEAFQFDRASIIVATNAFGMGIDKSNVRFVVHYSMPRDLESYYQEAGRAGRDGEPSDCVLLYAKRDVALARWMIEHSHEEAALDDEQRQLLMLRDQERLKQMTFYATTDGCLRQFILRYFGENAPAHCGNCSNCLRLSREADFGAKTTSGKTAKPHYVAAYNVDEKLLVPLKALRAKLAALQGVPAYAIFSDATLNEMAAVKPVSQAAFMEISGVGTMKCRRYGTPFMLLIGAYLRGEPFSDEELQGLLLEPNLSRNMPWSSEEDAQLREEFYADVPLKTVMQQHHRTSGAIRARLKKLGLLE